MFLFCLQNYCRCKFHWHMCIYVTTVSINLSLLMHTSIFIVADLLPPYKKMTTCYKMPHNETLHLFLSSSSKASPLYVDSFLLVMNHILFSDYTDVTLSRLNITKHIITVSSTNLQRSLFWLAQTSCCTVQCTDECWKI